MSMEGPRGAFVEEICDVVGLADGVFRSDSESSMGDEFPLLFAEENAENLRVILDDGMPVSLVAMLQREISMLGTRHLCCEIGSVCTHPEYRGRGLATRLVQDAWNRAQEHGCDTFLISGRRGLYRRLGFVDVGGYVRVTATARNLPESVGIQTRPAGPGDLPVLVELHSAETVRFVRPPEDFSALLQEGCIKHGVGETRIITRGTRPVAYVLYAPPGSYGAEEKELCIGEMAGSRLGVAQALTLLFDQYDLERVHIEGLAFDRELAHTAAIQGWSVEPHGFHGTVGIINPATFWGRIRPLVEERLGEEASGLDLRFDGQEVTVSFGSDRTVLVEMSDFTRLVFLPQPERHTLNLGLAAGSDLRRILDRVFPLPLVNYGLNYV